MRRGLIAANWKMNGRKVEVDTLLTGLLSGLNEELLKASDNSDSVIDVVVCPPSLYVSQAHEKLAGSNIQLGVQNIHTEDKGAFTGEISAQMLQDFDCHFVLVGHSERRELFGEDDELVAKKFASAQKYDLTPILCVGESLEQRESGETEKVILAQLRKVLDKNNVNSFRRAVVAYEPIWAIGTGLTATPEQAQEVHRLIRDEVTERDVEIGRSLRILYGGSVKSTNAQELFTQEDIDGALVGGASLQADEFVSICLSMANK